MKIISVKTIFLLMGFVSQCALAQQMDSWGFDQLLDGKQSAPVIITLKSDAPAKDGSRQGSINSGWLNLNDYIDKVQQEVASDMGWVNFNDIVKYKHVPALAKQITQQEYAQLSASNKVEGIYPDRFHELQLIQSKKIVGIAPQAGSVSGGAGVSVAVIDSGIEINHPFFQERVVDGACFSRFGSCPGGRKVAKGRSAGQACSGNRGCMHGTHVAGIVAGKNSTMSGMAPDSNVLSINVFSIMGGRFGAADSDVMQALEWVLENKHKHNIVAVNMSLGGGYYSAPCDNSPVKRFIDVLLQNGVISVIASGNDGTIDGVASPACVQSAITVGSTEPDGRISSFSNSYFALDMVAPGGKILSSTLNGKYVQESGTSMAAPHVAGAIALLASEYPRASVNQLMQALAQGPTMTDPRNNIRTPRLHVPSASAWLSRQNLSSHAPDKNAKKDKSPKNDSPQSQCDEQRIDGILMEQSSRCGRQEEGFQW